MWIVVIISHYFCIDYLKFILCRTPEQRVHVLCFTEAFKLLTELWSLKKPDFDSFMSYQILVKTSARQGSHYCSKALLMNFKQYEMTWLCPAIFSYSSKPSLNYFSQSPSANPKPLVREGNSKRMPQSYNLLGSPTILKDSASGQ